MRYNLAVLLIMIIPLSVHGMELDSKNKKLVEAARHNKSLNVRTLLFCGADPNAHDNHIAPLHYVVRHGNIPLMACLAAKGANVNAVIPGGITPLHFAVIVHNTTDVAAWLLDHGAEIDMQDECGYAPIHIAASLKKRDLVHFLIYHGARIDVPDNKGNLPEDLDPASFWYSCYSPFKNAILKGDGVAMQGYLEQGAQVDFESFLGTPIHWAIASADTELMLPILLTHGLKKQPVHHYIHIQDASGQTPLHWAGGLGDLFSWKQLLLHGAQLNILDFEGAIPFDRVYERLFKDDFSNDSVNQLFKYLTCPLGIPAEFELEVHKSSKRIFTFLCCLHRLKSTRGILLPNDVLYKVLSEYLLEDLRVVPLGSYYKRLQPSQLIECTSFRLQSLLSNVSNEDTKPLFLKKSLVEALVDRHITLLQEARKVNKSFLNRDMRTLIKWLCSLDWFKEDLIWKYNTLLDP